MPFVKVHTLTPGDHFITGGMEGESLFFLDGHNHVDHDYDKPVMSSDAWEIARKRGNNWYSVPPGECLMMPHTNCKRVNITIGVVEV